MIKIPITQMPILNHPVCRADFEEDEANPCAGEIVSWTEPKEEWGGKFKFVAPSFAEMMLDIQKLEATLRAIESGCEFVLPPEDKGVEDASGGPSPGVDRTSAITVDEFRQMEFYLYAPMAESVQLVAGFTRWQKFPLDMVKSEGGTWSLVIPLPAGQYDYAFVVDGQWQIDSQLRSMLVGPAAKTSSERAAA
jgi:hypothetical protein